jgi:hypothetical protein
VKENAACRQQRLTAAVAAQAWRGGGGGAADGGCAGAVEEAARAREMHGCRAGRWRRRGGGLRRAAAVKFRRARARRRWNRELYGADEEKEGERESLYEGLDPLVTR